MLNSFCFLFLMTYLSCSLSQVATQTQSMILLPSHLRSAASFTQVFLLMGLAESLCFTDGIPEAQLSHHSAGTVLKKTCVLLIIFSLVLMVPGLKKEWSQPKGLIPMEISSRGGSAGFACAFASLLQSGCVMSL